MTTSTKQSWLQGLLAGLPALIFAMVILGAVTLLTYTGHFTATEGASALFALAGAVGVVAVAVLVSQQPNVNLVSHLVFTIAFVVAFVALTLHDVFSSTQTLPLITLLIGSGATAAGVSSLVSANTAANTPSPSTTVNITSSDPVPTTSTAAPDAPPIPAGFAASDPGTTASAN